MSFTQDCPFCGQRMEVPDELDGRTSNCPGCGAEVYFSREDAARQRADAPDRDAHADAIKTARAAAVASRPDVMPPITMEWAFQFVIKITFAALVIDVPLYFLIALIVAALRSGR